MDRRRKHPLAAIGIAVSALALLSAVPAAADAYRDVLLKGKDLFKSQCLNCHQTTDEIAGETSVKSSWPEIVKDMVGRGAKLDAEQQAIVVEYLAGRMILVSKCRSCHTINRPLTASKSPEEWKGTVERMAKKMPKATGLTPEQIEKLSVFLAVERPPL